MFILSRDDIRWVTVRSFYLLTVSCLLSFACGVGTTQAPQPLAEFLPHPAALAYPAFDGANDIQDFAKPHANAIAVNFGRAVELKAVYLEKREPVEPTYPDIPDGNLQRHFGLLATSSLAGTALTAEGELAYSHLGSLSGSCECNERPMMMRLALKNRWQALSYGGDYRSFDPGFVSIAGAQTDLHREEGELWGERSWGALKLRGSLAQIWEKPRDATAVRVTRGATAIFNYSRPQWGGSFASSYSVVQPETAPDHETTVANLRIAGSYHPVSSIRLAPSLSFRQEWNAETGSRVETPATGLAFVYTPFKDWIRLSSDTTVTRSFSIDGSSDIRTFGTGAALDWKIGKFVGAANRLSFSVNYNHRLDLLSQANSQKDVRGMLLLQVTGF
jgi:hypothetical protein